MGAAQTIVDFEELKFSINILKFPFNWQSNDWIIKSCELVFDWRISKWNVLCNVEKNIDICFVDRKEKKGKRTKRRKKKENGKTNMAVDCQKQHEKIVVETFLF